jgi:hypothetical protein
MIADLRMADHRRPRPTGERIGPQNPIDDDPGLPRGEAGAHDEPAVLRLIAPVVEGELAALRFDGDAPLGVLGREHQPPPGRKRGALDRPGSAPPRGPDRITREDSARRIGQIGFREIGRRQKLQVEARPADEPCGQRLVELHAQTHPFASALDADRVVEALALVREADLDGALSGQHLPLDHLGGGVPLTGSGLQTHIAIGRRADAMVDQLHPGDLRIAEGAIIPVVEDEHIEPAPGETSARVERQAGGSRRRGRFGRGNQWAETGAEKLVQRETKQWGSHRGGKTCRHPALHPCPGKCLAVPMIVCYTRTGRGGFAP